MNPSKKIGFFAVKILICIIAFKIMKNNLSIHITHKIEQRWDYPIQIQIK